MMVLEWGGGGGVSAIVGWDISRDETIRFCHSMRLVFPLTDMERSSYSWNFSAVTFRNNTASKQ